MSESTADRFADRVPLSLLRRIKSSVVRVQDALVLGLTLSLIFLLRPILDIRLAAFDTQRIGEWIQRMDLSLSLARLDDTRASRRRLHIFVLCGVQRNEQLDLMYKRHIKLLKNVVLLDVRTSRWAKILRKPALTVSLHAMQGTGLRAVYSGDARVTLDSCGLYPNGRPFLAFSSDEEERGSQFLDLLGISQESKIACVHIRDEAYLTKVLSARDWSYHNYRNPPVDSYVATVQLLIDNGWTVVRMGREVERQFPLQHASFIDYAVSPHRSDFLDVFLYAKSQLAIAGSISGIDQLAHAFQIPHVATNFIPFEDPRWATANAIALPALYRSKASEGPLPLSVMLGHRYGTAAEYVDAGITIIHNDSQDILQAVSEMMSRLDGTWIDTHQDLEDQERFWEWALQCGIADAIPPGPWQQSFTRARLGTAFLRKFQGILMT